MLFFLQKRKKKIAIKLRRLYEGLILAQRLQRDYRFLENSFLDNHDCWELGEYQVPYQFEGRKGGGYL